MRSICPFDDSLSTDWTPIHRPWYTNTTLLENTRRVQRLIRDDLDAVKNGNGVIDHPELSDHKIDARKPQTGEIDVKIQVSDIDPTEPIKAVDKVKSALASDANFRNAHMHSLTDPSYPVLAPSISISASLKNESSRFINSVNGKAYKLGKVLILSKTTRYEHERARWGIDGPALKVEMTRRGFDYEGLKSSNDAHERSMTQLISSIQKFGIEYHIVKIEHFDPDGKSYSYAYSLIKWNNLFPL